MEPLFKEGDLPGELPARLIETLEALGLPHESDTAQQQSEHPTTDEKVLLAAFERGEALYRKQGNIPSPGVTDAREEIGNAYTASLCDDDGLHYQVRWVFNQVEQLLFVQYRLLPKCE